MGWPYTPIGQQCPYGVSIFLYRAAASSWGSGAPMGWPYVPIGQLCPYGAAMCPYGVSICPYRAAVPLWGGHISL